MITSALAFGLSSSIPAACWFVHSMYLQQGGSQLQTLSWYVRYGPKALRRPAVGKGLQLRAFVKFHCASAGALASDLILVVGRAGAVALVANLRCHDGCPSAGHSASQPQRDLVSAVTVVLGVK